jgi:hypothetical protein
MKGFTVPLLWFFGMLVAYVLASGPAILIERGSLGRIIDILFLPLSYLASYTPAIKVLLPYREFWTDKAGVESCPFVFG